MNSQRRLYDVYAIGNALVDIEYEVTPEQLTELKIEKGVMTLVDELQQAAIVERLAAHQGGRGSGGSAANTMIALCQLGGQGFYSCRVANDETGQFYVEDLGRAGVVTSLEPEKMAEGITGKCLVLITPDADRTMHTFLGASADISIDDVDETAIEQAEYLYVEGYLVAGPSSRSAALHAARKARESGTKIAFSLSDPNIVHYFRPAIEELVGEGIDLLFANEDEAKCMAGTEDLDEAIESIKKIARQFVITRGPEGAVAFDGTSLHTIAPVPVQAIDTVGAGDMYAGAFLYGITSGMDFPRAGRLASLAASRIVSTMGPRLKLEQLKEILQDFEESEKLAERRNVE